MRGDGNIGNFREGHIFPELKEYTGGGKYQKNFLEMDFEEPNRELDELRERVAKNNGHVRIMVHPLYYIPTEPKDPTPKFSPPDIDDNEVVPPPTEKENWDRLYELFKKVGVEKAIVGGIILDISYFDNDPSRQKNYAQERIKGGSKTVPYTLNGCVGVAIEQLSDRGIETEVSSIFSSHGDEQLPHMNKRSYMVRTEKRRSLNYPDTQHESSS